MTDTPHVTGEASTAHPTGRRKAAGQGTSVSKPSMTRVPSLFRGALAESPVPMGRCHSTRPLPPRHPTSSTFFKNFWFLATAFHLPSLVVRLLSSVFCLPVAISRPSASPPSAHRHAVHRSRPSPGEFASSPSQNSTKAMRAPPSTLPLAVKSIFNCSSSLRSATWISLRFPSSPLPLETPDASPQTAQNFCYASPPARVAGGRRAER